MLEKLLLLVAAGAAVTVTNGGVTKVVLEHPSSAPAIDASAPPAPPAFEVAAPAKPTDEDEREQRPEREAKRPAAPAAPAACVEARVEARQAVQAGYAKFHAALEQLRAERAAETVTRADAMLREIAEKADRVLGELDACADLQTVAERAVAAMETVASLAKSAATPTPKPTERPRPTEKPKPAAKPKPSACDERVAAAKKALASAFERWHSKNDELWKQAEDLDNDAVFAVVKNADRVMHAMYDSSKDQIAKTGCAEGLGLQIAAYAAGTFERAYAVSNAAMETAARR